jgi:8-oxo-dGTP pyrophosphatase MutT (NUDIX family)
VRAHSAYITGMESLIRHIRACNNAVLPGGRVPVFVRTEPVGWALPGLAEQMIGLGAEPRDGGVEIQPDRLQAIARALADRGAFPWRAEPFDVRSHPEGEVLGQLDRGALPKFGVQAMGVHLNGLVGDRLWVGRRARDKLLDPGKLDHLVAGGVPAGYAPEQTLLKEAEEEAGLPADLARRAEPVGRIAYAFERAEGLRRDVLYCYDLELPESFWPVPRDGEVEAFELWDLDRVLDAVRHTDEFKFNVNLVLIDLFLRRGLVRGAEADALRSARTAYCACKGTNARLW